MLRQLPLEPLQLFLEGSRTVRFCKNDQTHAFASFPPMCSIRHSSYKIIQNLFMYSLYTYSLSISLHPFSNCHCPSDMADSATTVAKVAGLSSEQDVQRAVLALHENMPKARQPTATCLPSWVSPSCHPPNGS